MDGAETQVAAAQDVLENQLGLSIPVAGMVKNTHHKTADLMNGEYQKVQLDPKSEAFYLLQRIQDEVHRLPLRSTGSCGPKIRCLPG